jgi:hypothetical protein
LSSLSRIIEGPVNGITAASAEATAGEEKNIKECHAE